MLNDLFNTGSGATLRLLVQGPSELILADFVARRIHEARLDE
jgi:hypothetical protein